MPELMCASYEPRFQLIGVGTADGRVLAFNVRHAIQVPVRTIRKPICAIASCVNTSSFMAVSSPGMHGRHANRLVPGPACSTFAEHRFAVNRSTVSHWSFGAAGAVMRASEIPHDVVSFAVSPSHPHFAILGLADGSIMGFSVETMGLTSLYIASFESKGLRYLACSRGLDCYVCASTLERIQLATLELSTCAKTALQTIDVVGDGAAAISGDGRALLLRGFKTSAAVDRVRARRDDNV